MEGVKGRIVSRHAVQKSNVTKTGCLNQKLKFGLARVRPHLDLLGGEATQLGATDGVSRPPQRRQRRGGSGGRCHQTGDEPGSATCCCASCSCQHSRRALQHVAATGGCGGIGGGGGGGGDGTLAI